MNDDCVWCERCGQVLVYVGDWDDHEWASEPALCAGCSMGSAVEEQRREEEDEE